MEINNKVFIVSLLIILIASSIYFFSLATEVDPLTGHVVQVVQEGRSAKLDDQQKPNPNKGILKGKVEYTISDNGEVIDVEPASNAGLYFVHEGEVMDDYALVKLSAEDVNYKGSINNIDPDDDNVVCSRNNYETTENYYDLNNNNAEEPGEFKVYLIVADNSGCYAAKLLVDSYDIFI